MKFIFGFFMALFGLIVTFGIFPAAKTHLDDFIDNVMPNLNFPPTLVAYVSFMPYILFALMLIIGTYVALRR